MPKNLRQIIYAFAVAAFIAQNALGVTAGVEFIGRGSVSGSAIDRSGLTGNICQLSAPANCVPKAILGGFGSDVSYTGHDNVFIAAPDRGPFDGLTDTPYLDRFHFFHITLDTSAAFNDRIRLVLLDTRFLKNESGERFTGAAGVFDNRLDPEGIAVAPDGTFYVSDEYGPYIFQFDRQGNIIRRLTIPSKFAISNPNADPELELRNNTAGRQANRGTEGLTISPDGKILYGMMQNALIQDNGLVTPFPTPPTTVSRLGINNRILKIDLETGATNEFVYQIDAIGNGRGANELLAINDHEFLVVERDNRSFLAASPSDPRFKKIYKININGATDVSGTSVLPAGALPSGITPVQKSVGAATFIDLLDPAFGLNLNNANAIAEKIEALACGPDLEDGRHLLYVFSDNDLTPTLASQVFAFAIDPEIIALDRVNLPGPLFPPGQVKKIMSRDVNELPPNGKVVIGR